MKKIALTMISLAAFAAALSADDRPMAFEKLPVADMMVHLPLIHLIMMQNRENSVVSLIFNL